MTEFTDKQRSDGNTAINAKLWAICQAEAKRKYRIHPSAYSNGYASKIYKERGGTWRSDSLKTWFNEDWKAINSSGKIVGGCGDGATKGKVKCLPASKARSLSKKDRSTLAKRKQAQDPNPDREGAPVMVSSKRRDSMTPTIFAQAILSIEQKYGLRLDARSAWLRMDEFKKVKELKGGKCNEATGWYGLKGACKRGKKGEGDARNKESKVDIADRIRNRKKNEVVTKKGSDLQANGKKISYRAFRDDFKKAYQKERARQEMKGVVSIHADKLLKQFVAEKGISEKDGQEAFDTLKKKREILTVIERGNTLMQWVE